MLSAIGFFLFVPVVWVGAWIARPEDRRVSKEGAGFDDWRGGLPVSGVEDLRDFSQCLTDEFSLVGI
jgi:hypothetical protein